VKIKMPVNRHHAGKKVFRVAVGTLKADEKTLDFLF